VSLTVTGPGGSDMQTQIDLVVVHTAASATVRNGSGVNPLVYSSTAPILGQSWTGTLDVSGHPGAGLTFLLIRSGGSPGSPTPYGELLLNPSSAFILNSSAPSAGGQALHTLPFPSNLSLEGVQVATQCVILGGFPELTNAVDLRLGF